MPEMMWGSELDRPKRPGSGGGQSDIERGVYPAKWGYIDAQIRMTEKRPDPYVMLYFEAEGKPRPMSQEIGSELAYTIWLLTRKEIDKTGSPEVVAKRAQAALTNCQWSGLVYIGKSGFVERLQAPDAGEYTFMFGEFTRRGDGTINVWQASSKWGGEGATYPNLTARLIICGGQYDGYHQICTVPCEVARTDDGGWAPWSAALEKFMRAGGLTKTYVKEQIDEQGRTFEEFFPDPDFPFPGIEALLIQRAGEGYRIVGSIVNGWTNVSSLSTVVAGQSPQPSPQKQTFAQTKPTLDDGQLLETLVSLARRVWPNDDVQIFDQNGFLTHPQAGDKQQRCGVTLCRLVLLPLVGVVDGLTADWPPSIWPGGKKTLDEVGDVLSKLLLLHDSYFFLLTTENAKEQMADWVKAGCSSFLAEPF